MIALSLSIAFSRRSEPKASNLRTVGLEFTASRLTAGAMGKGLFVLFLVFSRWFWFPSSVPPCWQSSLPQGLALCCGACVLGDRADYPPTLFFGGACFCWPLLAFRDPALLFCSLLFVLWGRAFSPSKRFFPA